uniref:Flocculation protein FLO11-like n=1 Tax=Panagrellus redivivus TaxID=6233 RepID=A0A7E4W954_PANRE
MLVFLTASHKIMSDTLLSGRKRRESHKPKTFSPEPSGPPTASKKGTPKNGPKTVTPKSAKAPKKGPPTTPIDLEPGPSSPAVIPEDSKKNGSQKTPKSKKKTPTQSKATPLPIASTPVVLDDAPSSSSSIPASKAKSKSKSPTKDKPKLLIDVSPKKPPNLPGLKAPKSNEAGPSTSSAPTRPRAFLSLKRTTYNSHSDDELFPLKVEVPKKGEESREVDVHAGPSVSKMENVDPTVSIVSEANSTASDASPNVTTAETREPEPEPSTSTVEPAAVKMPENIPEGLSSIFKMDSESTPTSAETSFNSPAPSKLTPSTSKATPPAHSISLRTGRERKAPPSKDYDPTSGSSHRRDSISSSSFISPKVPKKPSKPKSSSTTPNKSTTAEAAPTEVSTPAPALPTIVPVLPPIAPVLPPPEPQTIELQPITDPEKRPKLTLRIPKGIRSGSGRSTPATPAAAPSDSGRNTPADIVSKLVSSIMASANAEAQPKVPPIKLNLSKLASGGSRPVTPAVFNLKSSASSPKIPSRPLTPQDVGSLISLATTSRSGRIRKPPPSKEYPGHIDQPISAPPKRRESKTPMYAAPSASMFNFPEFAIQPASTSMNLPSTNPPPTVSIPLLSAPAMSRSDYAVNFNNATSSMFGYHSPMMALNPTPAPTPVSLQPPTYLPQPSVFNPPTFAAPSTSASTAPKPAPSTSTVSYHRPTSLAENIFNRPSRNKSKGVADLAPSLMPRDMQKRASITAAPSSSSYAPANYYQQQPGPSSAYQIPASAGTASHMFKYEDDYTNGYGYDTGRPLANQKRRATAPTRGPAKKAKVVAFDSSGESLDTSDLNIDRTIIDYGDDAIEYLSRLHKHIAKSLKHYEDDYEENFFLREILTTTVLTEDYDDSEDDDILDVGSPDPVLPPRSLDAPPPEHNRASAKLVRQLIELLPRVERKTLVEMKEVAEAMVAQFDIRGKALLDLGAVISDQYTMEIAIAGRSDSMALFHAHSLQNATKFPHAWLLQNLDEYQLGSYLTLLKYLRPAGTTLSDLFVQKAVDSIAVTNEIMGKIVVERARDPYIRMLTQLTRRLKKPNVYVVLVYPGITFDDDTISPIYHAHEQIFLGLSSMGAVVEKLAINDPFPMDKNPNMNQASDYAVEYVRNKLKDIINRRPGDRIFVAAWGLPCLFVHEAVLDVSGITGLIDLAIPMMSPHGHRGIVGDKMLRTYCPTLLIIGEEAENAVVADVVDCLENFVAQAGLIIVGAADESLIVDVETLTRYGLTQACINRLIIHHIMDFIDIIIENTQNEFHTKKLTLPYPFISTADYGAHVMRDDKDVDPVLTFEEDLKAISAELKLLEPKSPPPTPSIEPGSSTAPPLTNGHEHDAEKLSDGVSKYFNSVKQETTGRQNSNEPSRDDTPAETAANGPTGDAPKTTNEANDGSELPLVRPRVDEEMEQENRRAAAALLALSDSDNDPF